MAFTIPNIESAPTFDAQSIFENTDLTVLANGVDGNGVISGCLVTPHTGSDMNVSIAAGVVQIAGVQVTVAAVASLAIGVASTFDRKDMVVVNSSGVISVTAGTPCTVAGWTQASSLAPPVKAPLSSNSVLLAEVYVAAATTAIATGNIVDRTLIVQVGPVSVPAIATASGTGIVDTFQAVNPDSQLRFIIDGQITSGSPTLVSATANFTLADVGKSLANWVVPGSSVGGIPSGTTISSYTNATTVTMSANATATLTPTPVQIGLPLTWSLPTGTALGITMTIKNISSTLGILLVPTGGDTINSSTATLVLAPQTVLTLTKDTSTNWAPTSTRITGALLTSPRNSVGIVGTSYSIQCWVGAAYGVQGWFTWAQINLGHRLVIPSGAFNALTGSGVCDAGFLARLQLVLVANPGTVILEVGPNDVGNGSTSAAIIAALTTAISTIISAGKNCVLLTIPPHTGWSSGQNLIQATVNDWIREQQSQNGVITCDIAAALTDPANATSSQFVSGYTNDGTHLTPLGASICGTVIANQLAPLFSATNLPPASDAANLLTQAMCVWTGGTGSGFPNSGGTWNWSPGNPTGSVTYSQPSRASINALDPIPGLWQQMVFAAGVKGILRPTATVVPVIGQTYVAYLEFEAVSLEASPSANTQSLYLAVLGFTAGFAVTFTTGDNYPFLTTDAPPPPAGILMTAPFTIPLLTTSVLMEIGILGGGTYRFGRVGIIPVV